MRVATRRLRSTLRSFAPMLTGDLDALHEEVKWVTGLLGAVRDTDVMGERLDHLVHAEPAELVLGPVAARITSLLAAQAAEARKALTAGLDSPRYTALLNDIDALVARTGPAPRKRLMRLARKAQRRADGRLDAATSDAEMHESRKAYKRARYAAELVAPVAGKPATALADRITDLQDALGTHQDAMVTASC
ncbi:hypothetical protein GCM10020218_102030 [Dactylosporangium vinaceum]